MTKRMVLTQAKTLLGLLLLLFPLSLKAQVGEYRSDFSLGINAGYVMSNIGFDPKVPQTMHTGITAGLSFRYVCEKYFNTICSVYGELNYAEMGWKQEILTTSGEPVINTNGVAEQYSRSLSYLQMPIFAHLAWGKERNGFNFFVKAGPQVGLLISEKITKNYDTPNLSKDGTGRSSGIIEQEGKAIEKKFDYGIAAGLGAEWSHDKVGHFLIEARYYYGLGNLYNSSKTDYFGRSNNGSIILKLTYLFDLTKTSK